MSAPRRAPARAAVGALVAATLTLGVEAHAQPREAPPPPPEDTPTALDPAWRSAVDEALALLSAGRVDEARARLRRARDAHPGELGAYDALVVLQRLADALALPTATADDGEAPAGARGRSRSSLELVTLYGTGLAFGAGTGLWVDALAQIDTLRVGVWIPLLGAGLGVLGAYAMDRGRPLRAGRATAMNTGLLLGASAGLAVALQHNDSIDIERERCFSVGGTVCDVSGSDRWKTRGMATATWLGAGLGLGLGYGIASLTDSAPGSASFVLSAGTWGGFLGFFAGILGDFDDSLGAFWLAGSGLGTIAAVSTAQVLRPTQAQTRWLDLGVLGGGLLGLGVAVLVDGNLRDRVLPLTCIELGMVGGGLTAFLLSRSANAPRAPPGPQAHYVPGMLPLPGGGLVTLSFPNL